MNKGLTMIAAMVALALLFSAIAQAQIYKVVDEQGNVTYTDQVPPDGSAPMVLPELSVVETDIAPEPSTEVDEEAATDSTTANQPTPRELRSLYQDFRITRPSAEETFWGTENMVVVSWGSATALQANMSVRLFVDGQPQANTRDNMAALKLERGEHQVYAELLDARGRRMVTTATVTFFVKQNAIGINQPRVAPH